MIERVIFTKDELKHMLNGEVVCMQSGSDSPVFKEFMMEENKNKVKEIVKLDVSDLPLFILYGSSFSTEEEFANCMQNGLTLEDLESLNRGGITINDIREKYGY